MRPDPRLSAFAAVERLPPSVAASVEAIHRPVADRIAAQADAIDRMVVEMPSRVNIVVGLDRDRRAELVRC